MCENLKPYDEPSFTGYKVVGKKKKGTCYYSLAIGFKYPVYPNFIGIRKVQKTIAFDFVNGILNKNTCAFNKDMQGRTAVFVEKEAALAEADYLKYSSPGMAEGYYIIVVRATLYDDLMKGTYGFSADIIAGRRIKFHEEIDINQA